MINEILNVTDNVLIDDNGEVITISKVASKQKSTKKPLIVEETTLGAAIKAALAKKQKAC